MLFSCGFESSNAFGFPPDFFDLFGELGHPTETVGIAEQ